MPTRHFTPDELAALGVPPDTHDDLMYSDTLIADEFITTLKYSAQRRVIFRAPDDGKTYAVGYEGRLDVGDFEVGDGPPDYGWHGDTVEGIEVEEQEVTVTQWLPVEHDEECPRYSNPAAPNCHCEGIDQAEENYRTEPPGFLG